MDQKHYSQINSVSMGSIPSPNIESICLCSKKTKWVETCRINFKLVQRHADGSFVFIFKRKTKVFTDPNYINKSINALFLQ